MALPWQVELWITGNYDEVVAERLAAVARGATKAARKILKRGKDRLRADTRRGFADGARLANTWRGTVYPNVPGVYSTQPAVVLFSAAPVLAMAFEAGARIRAANGSEYICVPTENAPKPTQRRVGERTGRDWLARARQSYPEMEFIPVQAGRFGLLAVKRKAANGEEELLVLFLCVRDSRLRKRMNFRRIFRDLEAEWPRLYEAEVTRELRATID